MVLIAAASLVVLTMAEDGDLRLSAGMPQPADDCAAAMEVVTQVIGAAGTRVVAARCGDMAGLRLSPFIHGAPPEAETHRFRIRLPRAGGFQLEPLAPDAPCEAQPDAAEPVLCARSSQFVLRGQ
ncbi:MAG: hypothetical protein Q4G25_14725 [Paracoccus sp. (in: a-proteobacteria)]|nr:hypothetical protein [Paracoccus sp. (in: a-proteobacteria)]